MLGLRHVPIISFSRVNFHFTVLSKRKLTWFVDSGRVSGWDDPRFPTVRGVLRRGVQVDALKEFILAMGFTKKDVDMEWNKFWTNNKKMIDPVAHRYFAVDGAAVPLEVRGGPEVPEAHAVPLHPKDDAIGAKAMFRFHRLLVEPDDAKQFKEGEEITLSRWANVILREVHRRADGSVERAVADLHEAGDFRTTTLRIGWVADVPAKCPALICEFDYLITKPTLEDTDDFKEYINPQSYAETRAIGEAALRSCVANQVIQLERRGYFRVDRPYIDEARPLVLYAIPTGKVGAESALSSKIVLADQKLVRDRIAASSSATSSDAAAPGAATGGGAAASKKAAKKPAAGDDDEGGEA
jgi:glutamyl-tRNA synthetase